MNWTALAMALPAMAAVPATGRADELALLEEFVVTARKREESPLDIPQEIQAISQQELERANISTLQDLQRFVPSLTYNGNMPGAASIYFRGVAEGTAMFTADSSAAVYLDEQPLTQSGLQPEIRLIDIERIEALPGPQGTLYGSSSQSGTLRYITNKPDLTGFHADVSLDAYTVDQGDEGYELTGVLNLPLGEKTAIRLVGFSAHDAGYIDNVPGESLGGTFNNAGVVDEDVNPVEYAGGRAAVRSLVGENWTVDVGVVYQQLDANAYSDDNVLRAGREFAVVLFLDEFRSDEWTHLALTLQGDFGWGQLTSATSYFTRDIDDLRDYTDYTFDLTFFSNPTDCPIDPTWTNCAFALGPDPVSLGAREKDRADRVAQEFRLQGVTGNTTWLAGLFYEHMEYEFEFVRRIENYESTTAFQFWNTEYGVQRGTTDNADYASIFNQLTKQIAVFGEASWSPSDRWSFTAGLRWFEHSRDREEWSHQPLGNVRFYDESEASTSDITGKLSVQYNINENAMVYVLFSDGFRAGGGNIAVPGAVLPAEYDPDFLDNYEIGFKSRWDGGRYTLNITAFKMKWEDYQAEVIDPGPFPEYYLVAVANIGDAEIDGIGADFTAYFLDSLGFGLNLQLLNARVTAGNALVGTQAGDRLPFSAEEKGAAWLEYTFPPEVAGGHVYGRFQWTYTGDSLSGIWPSTLQPAYGISDFKVGFESGDWGIYAYVDNLTDERAILRDWQYGPVSINRPRTWGLGFSKSWGGT
jgi:outer membrane receptor protein involved in Fe transport